MPSSTRSRICWRSPPARGSSSAAGPCFRWHDCYGNAASRTHAFGFFARQGADRLPTRSTRIEQGLLGSIDDVHVNGSRTRRLPGTLNVSFGGVEGHALIMSLPMLAVSSNAACTSAVYDSSHVLTALGVVEPLAGATLRFGIGRFNTEVEIDIVLDECHRAVRRLRSMLPPLLNW